MVGRAKRFLMKRLSELGVDLYRKGKIVLAMKSFQAVIELEPNNQAAFLAIEGILNSACASALRIEVIQKWLEAHPADLFTRLRLMEIYLNEQQAGLALECLAEASSLDATSPLVALMSGLLCRSRDDLDGAERHFRSVLAEYPKMLQARMLLASNLVDQGRKAEAISELEKAVVEWPESPAPYFELASLKYYKDEGHPHVMKMKELAGNVRPDNNWIMLRYALGNVYDSLGQYGDAFRQYRLVNDFRKNFWQLTGSGIDGFQRGADQLIETFNRRLLEQFVRDDPIGSSLVFIVGMPRSGTSLVEQILASHPGVHAQGEKSDVPTIINWLSEEPDAKDPYPQILKYLDCDKADHLAKRYFEEFVGSERVSLRTVDKMVFNYMNVGLIRCLFPKAKIIHCRRSRLDTILSNYFQHFASISYSCDLSAISLVFSEYDRLMTHWRETLPGGMLEIVYEDLVANPEPLVRDLLNYCDLAWDPNCLSFHNTRRAVYTASKHQVKASFHSRSVERWRHYEEYLGEIISPQDTIPVGC